MSLPLEHLQAVGADEEPLVNGRVDGGRGLDVLLQKEIKKKKKKTAGQHGFK